MPLIKPPNIESLKQDRDREGMLRALGYKRDAAVRRAAAEALIEWGHAPMVLDAAFKMGKSQAVAPLLALLERETGEGTRRKAAETLLACYKEGGLSAQDKQAILALKGDIHSAVHRDFTGPLARHRDQTYHVKHRDEMNCFGDMHYDTDAHQAHTDRRHTDTRPHVDLPPPTAAQIEAGKDFKAKSTCGIVMLFLIGALLVIGLLSKIPAWFGAFRPADRAETPTVVRAEAARPTSTATPRPTNTPEMVERLEPTNTPNPTATPLSTATPRSTATPLPTATPTAKPNTSQQTSKPTMTPLPTPTQPAPQGPALAVQTVVEAGSEVLDVALSPNGGLLALGCKDGSVQLWNGGTGQKLRALQGHDSRVLSVAISPDGATLASADNDGQVRLWEAASGKLLHTLQAHTLWVNSVAFSPDGQVLASASADRSVRLWDVASGEKLRALTGHLDWVRDVAFSPAGDRIASASCGEKESADSWECQRGEIRLWDAGTGEELQTLAGHDGWVQTLSFAPDGRTLASGSDDKRVWIWDLDAGQETLILDEHRSWINGVAYSPDGRWLASVDDGGTLILWDARTWAPLVTERRHSDYVNDVAFAADERTLATGSADGTAIVWAVRNGR